MGAFGHVSDEESSPANSLVPTRRNCIAALGRGTSPEYLERGIHPWRRECDAAHSAGIHIDLFVSALALPTWALSLDANRLGTRWDRAPGPHRRRLSGSGRNQLRRSHGDNASRHWHGSLAKREDG